MPLDGHALAPFGNGLMGVACHRLTGGDIAGDACLGGHTHAIADVKMPGQATLPSQDDVVAQLGAAGNAHLSHDQAVGSGAHAVANLHQIVDLGAAANTGLANGGPVDGGVAAHLHAVFQHHPARLQHAPPGAIGEGNVAKAVVANDRAAVDEAVVANFGALVNDAVGEKLTGRTFYRRGSRETSWGICLLLK